MEDERWELLSPRARRAHALDALDALDVIARLGHERGCLRAHTAYTYPTSVGEWLAHAVQLAGGAIWQAPFIALLLPDAHEAGCPRAVQALGDAVFVFAAHVERGGDTPRVEIATCLEDALAWLCSAIACTDALLFAGLSDAPAD
ncbi:MAG: hypothetical protein LC777_16745 [Actinobacteria bacterium]|nr:hypothetical protein [Actinomycetota bacterium]